MNNSGIFSISLDFELHWGRFDKIPLNETQKTCLRNTRELIPAKLKLFEQYQTHVTWATVGMLFNHSANEWRSNKPTILPEFTNQDRSAYQWVEQNGFAADEYLLAPQLIQLIRNTAYQEIGTHTYAHYYCLEEGQTAGQFKADLAKAKEMAAKEGIVLRSLVFPRNQYNDEYLQVCADEGITSARSNPPDWFWSPTADENMRRKVFRAGDAYLPLGHSKAYRFDKLKHVNKKLPVLLPASRLYRPWQNKYPLLNKMKLTRILNEMSDAAKKKAYYHLWWHPENFGAYPKQCMEELEVILKHYSLLNKKYGLQSQTMAETADLLRQL